MPELSSSNVPGSENSNSHSSPFTPPSIGLPSGGGGIRGIGEKFATNSATGTDKLIVPLALSASRLGFNPQLSLSYDSGSGNGASGLGWPLSSRAVTRKIDKALPKYRHRETEGCDFLILSGADDLVPALTQNERGERRDDKFEREGYHVKRYRPGIEGLFACIEHRTRLLTVTSTGVPFQTTTHSRCVAATRCRGSSIPTIAIEYSVG